MSILSKQLIKHFFLPAVISLLVIVRPAWCQNQNQNPENSGTLESRAVAPYQQGIAALEAGNYPAAVALFRKSLSFYPVNKVAHHYLAVALIRAGNNEQAVAEFRTALNIDSRYVECRDDYGKFLDQTGQHQVAQKQFMDCISTNPKYPFAYYHLGQLLQEQGDLDGAIQNYQTAVDLKPDFFEAKRELGLAIYQKNDPSSISSAMDKLRDAEKLVPNNPMIHYQIGVVCCDNGKLDDAEAEFRSTLSLDPQHAAAHWELGKLRYYRGDIDRAIAEITAAQKVSPSYTDGKHYPKPDIIAMRKLKAQSLEFGGRISEAATSWRDYAAMTKGGTAAIKHAANLDKENQRRSNRHSKDQSNDAARTDEIIQHGESQYDDGDIAGAKSSFQGAIELDPRNFRANQSLGACLEESGELDRALLQYKIAAALNPAYDGAVYNQAYLLEKLGRLAEAGQMYQKFHSMGSAYPYDPKHIVSLEQADIRERAKAK